MHWVRFERAGQTGFGTLRDGVIRIHEGDMFEGSSATSATVPLADVTLLTPCVPTKMIALWNNFLRARGQAQPDRAPRAAIPAQITEFVPGERPNHSRAGLLYRQGRVRR